MSFFKPFVCAGTQEERRQFTALLDPYFMKKLIRYTELAACDDKSPGNKYRSSIVLFYFLLNMAKVLELLRADDETDNDVNVVQDHAV